jgi:glucose-1-phosphate thymidylyltransferase
VVVEPGARLERSLVRGPAIIGAGATISDAYVGPYTSIYEGVTVERAEIEYSILLAGSSVSDLGARMEASLLGRNVKLARGDGLPRTLRMIVGDNSEVHIP